MTHMEIREKFLAFFQQRGHVVVPSASLLPTDPSVLFTTAGMQQFKPYYTGEADALKDFGSLNTASIQKCLRTSDIDEVGDESHLTFFEMLGNFSFGGYFKKEAIGWAHEFITKEMNLPIDYVSVFGGEGEMPADTESEKIWKTISPGLTVKKFGRADNFWGPTGSKGPCGPTTEIYVKPSASSGQALEIWNLVFNEYYQKPDGMLEKLKTPGIDTGMGLERLAMVVQQKGNIFETDLLYGLMERISEDVPLRVKRIIADHVRAIGFLITDGILPGNKDQGYVLRRLMRRVITQGQIHGEIDFGALFGWLCENYGPLYPELNQPAIMRVFDEEEKKFAKTLKQGLRELGRLEGIDASAAFRLYESYGLPYEISKDLGGDRAAGLTREQFDAEFGRHQEKSRAGAEKKFGGHGLLLDTGELKAGSEAELKKATRLHTATHLLQAALRKILGNAAKQAGSDITAERLRFDFTFSRKLSADELKQIEGLVNDAIRQDLPVTKKVMTYEDALKTGALSFFKLKYPPRVNVYTIGPENNWFSRELCGGPHVSHTGEIGGIKIVKEEAVSAGMRRIRAVLVV